MVGQTPASALQAPLVSLTRSIEGEALLESQDQLQAPSQPGTMPVVATFATPVTGSGRVGRRLQMWNCTFCRKDKKKCNRQSGTWPQKCERCENLGLPCSEAIRKNRKRKTPEVRANEARGLSNVNTVTGDNSLLDPLSFNAHCELTRTVSESGWDSKDLSNAIGMIQLVAAEYIEQEAACHAAALRLPERYTRRNSVLHARYEHLANIINVFGSLLRSEIGSRLETHQDSTTKEFLETSMSTVMDPLGGIFVHPTTSLNYIPQRPLTLQIPLIAESLQKRSVALIADGKVCQALIYHSKSAAYGHQQPNLQFSSAVKSLDIAGIMANNAAKFGLLGDFANRETWAWPSMIHPTLLSVPEVESLEAVLIKNLVGFDDCIKLLGARKVPGASPSDWKHVFRYMCRNSKTLKTAPDGYTCLHLAVLLGMGDEVNFLLETANFDLAIQDNYGYTALHLAVISGADLICDSLLGKGGDTVGILKKDSEGRTPLWYAAEKGKTKMYAKLKAVTLKHKRMAEIRLEKDKGGQSLAEYAFICGLESSHLLDLSMEFEFPNADHTRPDLYPVPYPDWKEEIPYSAGSGLSPWAQPRTGGNQQSKIHS